MNQVEFTGASASCTQFVLNTMRLNAKKAKVVCMSCSAPFLDHSAATTTEDDVAAYLAHLESVDGGSLIVENASNGAQLWCGSRGCSLKTFVVEHNIALVVNASNLHLEARRDFQEWARKVESLEKEGLVVHRLGWEDTEVQVLTGIREAVDMIEEYVGAGKHVVVHCAQGKSRSGAVVVAYLMRLRNLDADAALKEAQRRRPVIQPNDNFMRQLRKH